MALFMLLIMPLPFAMRRKVFTYALPPIPRRTPPNPRCLCAAANHHPPPRFISENPIVAKVQYWLKITFIFILVLFIDSVNRVYRVQLELAAVSDTNSGAHVYVLIPFYTSHTTAPTPPRRRRISIYIHHN